MAKEVLQHDSVSSNGQSKANDISVQETWSKVRRVLRNIVPPVNYGRKNEAIADSNPVLVALTTQIDELQEDKAKLEETIQSLIWDKEKREFDFRAIQTSTQTVIISLQKLMNDLGTRLSKNHLSDDNRASIEWAMRLLEGIQRI